MADDDIFKHIKWLYKHGLFDTIEILCMGHRLFVTPHNNGLIIGKRII